jgi:hypothetical protein
MPSHQTALFFHFDTKMPTVNEKKASYIFVRLGMNPVHTYSENNGQG